MDSNRRWLGWAAIGLGVILLLGMLGGPGRHGGWHGSGPGGGHAPWGSARQAPAAPGGQPGAASTDYARGYEDGLRAAQGPGGRRHGGPPLFFLGGLAKLIFLGLLALFALKVFGRWGGPGGWHRHHQREPQPPQRPGPEQPPYTGETHTL